MSRSVLSLLTLSCVLAGCPGGDDGKIDDTSADDSGVDTNCVEEDGDGFCVSDGDCDDNNPEVNPDAEEICDGKDNNCDGEIDENGETVYYADTDGDGFGDPDMSATACEPDTGWVANSDDCDDADSTVYPGADEQCDGLDNDCNGTVDDDLTTTYYHDADGDGYGDPSWTDDACSDPGDEWVSDSGDCNDAEPMAWTGASEICDGIDNDCNGNVDDGMASTWYPDADGDGYGDDSASFDSCLDPGAGYLATGGDCDDTEALAWTGASEYCDDVDNDCNGAIDDNALDATEQIADADGDGFGSATATTFACEPLVTNTWDCDDADANNPQVVDDSGSSSSADGSITNPWTTIQEGIDNASMCVVVMAGTYYENIDFGGADLDVNGVDGWASTVIDGGGAGSVVTFENGETAAAALHGFTIQNGAGTLDSTVTTEEDSSGATIYTTWNRYYGGGVIVDGAAPSLSELWITNNVLPEYSFTETSSTTNEYVFSYGGGIFASDSTGMNLSSVTIDWNYADEGGGVYGSDSSSFALSQSKVDYNEASYGGGVATQGTLDLTNAIVAGNWASAGAGLWIDGGSSTWWNVSAVGNDAAQGAGVSLTSGGAFDLYSSCVTDSITGEGVYGDGSGSFNATYSNVYGNEGGEYSGVTDPTGAGGDISVAPGYTTWSDDDTDNDDLSLASGSAMIDAGNPSAAYNDVDGTTNDIGAYGGPGGDW